MSYWTGVITTVLLFAVSGLAAGYLEARLRLLSVAHAAVMGTGAYAFAIGVRQGLSVTEALLLALGSGAILGTLTVGASRRVVKEDFALFSFALQVAWFGVMANARSWTGGALGLPGIKSLPFVSESHHVEGVLIWSIAVAFTAGIVVKLESGGSFPVAAAVVARSGELAETLGIPSRRIRLQIGAVYGLVLSAAGCIFGSFLTFIEPDVFSVSVSVILIGIGFLASWKWWGAALGAAVLVGFPEVLRAVGLASVSTAYIRQLLAGCTVAASAFVIFSGKGRR